MLRCVKHYESKPLRTKTAGQNHLEFSVFCMWFMQCLQQSGLFIKFLGIKPRIVVMACKIWESMRPHWPRTPKEVIHSWDWASYLFACGIYWVNGCSIIWQLKLNSCYILYSYILKCSVVIIFLWIFFQKALTVWYSPRAPSITQLIWHFLLLY